MARIPVRTFAILAGLLVIVALCGESVFAQGQPPDPGGGGRPGGGRGGGRGGDRGERMRKMMEEMEKAVADAASGAVGKALDAGKSEEDAKEAGRKAGDEELDRRIDEAVERMGQGRGDRGGNNPGGGGRGMDPEQMKERFKERAKEQIDKSIGETLDRAVTEYKETNWKEITPRCVLVDEDKEDREIEEAIKETTLFEDFWHREEKDIEKLKLTLPVIILFFVSDDGTKATERKIEKCAELGENVLSDSEFVSAAGGFIRFKVDISKLSRPLKKKYRANSAPVVAFYDCTGKRIWSFTSPRQKVKTLLKKMESYIERSEKVREKAQEEAEKGKAEKEETEPKGEEGGES